MDRFIAYVGWMLIDLIELAAICAMTASLVLGTYLIMTP